MYMHVIYRHTFGSRGGTSISPRSSSGASSSRRQTIASAAPLASRISRNFWRRIRNRTLRLAASVRCSSSTSGSAAGLQHVRGRGA